MNKLWRKSGTAAFWLSYPLLKVYLRIGWRTRVLVIVDGEVLLVKGWLGNESWQLPGGGAHRGEDHSHAAVRELKEETGIIVKPETLKLLYQDAQQYKGISFRYKCYYRELKERPAVRKQALEITELDWLPLLKVTEANATKDTYQAVQTWLNR